MGSLSSEHLGAVGVVSHQLVEPVECGLWLIGEQQRARFANPGHAGVFSLGEGVEQHTVGGGCVVVPFQHPQAQPSQVQGLLAMGRLRVGFEERLELIHSGRGRPSEHQRAAPPNLKHLLDRFEGAGLGGSSDGLGRFGSSDWPTFNNPLHTALDHKQFQVRSQVTGPPAAIHELHGDRLFPLGANLELILARSGPAEHQHHLLLPIDVLAVCLGELLVLDQLVEVVVRIQEQGFLDGSPGLGQALQLDRRQGRHD